MREGEGKEEERETETAVLAQGHTVAQEGSESLHRAQITPTGCYFYFTYNSFLEHLYQSTV